MRRILMTVAAAVSLFLMTTGLGVAGQPAPHAEYKPGELIVKYRQGKGDMAAPALHLRNGSQRVKEFREYDLEQVRLRVGQSVQEAITLFEADGNVEYAEPNYIVHASVIPYDSSWQYLWGMAKIGAPAAWDSTIGNSSVVIGTIDTGVDYNHPDLAANIWTGADGSHGYNTITHTTDPKDDNGHGTHVAGTIGGVGNNGIGVAGVNWQVKIMACKFLDATGSGLTTGAIDCLSYFRNQKAAGVNIIATNNSWGGTSYSQALSDAINAQREILFFAAAGNSATDNDIIASYPANYELPNVLAVAATDSADALASFSQYGRRTVELGAPGVSIYSTLPNSSYAYYSGTSMATPHVTGLAGLIKAKNPAADWRTVKNLILSTGDNAVALSTKTLTGKRINAAAALTCVDSRVMSAIQYPRTITVGLPATLSALSINCGASAGPVTVTLSGGEVITLDDDGITPDLAVGDGIFTATYTPVRSMESFFFLSPAGSETIGAVVPPLSIGTSLLASGTVGGSYSQTLAAGGGVTPYTWRVSAGALPTALALSNTGVISGTPTVVGTFTFTVTVTDSKGTIASRGLSITIAAPSVTLAVTTTTLPNATRNLVYQATLAALGGTKPYTWSISSGKLPTGLVLGSTTGVISGASRFTGTTYFTVKVKDAKGATATKYLSIRVN